MAKRISMEGEALSFAQALVRLPGLSGEEAAVARAVRQEMEALGYDDVQVDDLGNVLGVVRGERPGPTVLIDAHMDVVPATDPERWRFDPHSGELAEGRLWGRGAVDVRGSLAAAVVAVGMLPRRALRGEAIVAATVGEEMLEGAALAPVLRARRPSAVVVCEPTGLRLGTGHKGRAGLVVTAEGIPAHTSTPERGANAVYRMMEAVARLHALSARWDPLLGTGVSVLVEIASEPYPGSSIVPHLCRARFDRRLVRGEDAEGVLAQMRAAVAGVPGVRVDYHRAPFRTYTGRAAEVDDYHPAWAIDPASPVVQAAQRALRGAGQSGETWLAPYCTNGVASAGELGIPTLIYGAGEITDAHVVDESVAVAELQAAARGYQALALGLADGLASASGEDAGGVTR